MGGKSESGERVVGCESEVRERVSESGVSKRVGWARESGVRVA